MQQAVYNVGLQKEFSELVYRLSLNNHLGAYCFRARNFHSRIREKPGFSIDFTSFNRNLRGFIVNEFKI